MDAKRREDVLAILRMLEHMAESVSAHSSEMECLELQRTMQDHMIDVLQRQAAQTAAMARIVALIQ